MARGSREACDFVSLSTASLDGTDRLWQDNKNTDR